MLAARANGVLCGSFSRDWTSVGRRLLVVRIGRWPHLEFLADQVAVVVVVGRIDRMEQREIHIGMNATAILETKVRGTVLIATPSGFVVFRREHMPGTIGRRPVQAPGNIGTSRVQQARIRLHRSGTDRRSSDRAN